ncbi:MAG: hypothetical protein LBK99_14915 [Opitutaceae bacterium]|jgi:hypothetical protein|nr:hypothetical protein [Opitutaceae bacterium]
MIPRRIINIVNFIRYDDPRDPALDLLEPVVRQMQLLREAGLPCTWLLQFDALVAGPYVDFLKANLPDNHEVGLWFEINRMHCDAAGVAFRGADGLNWDHHVQAAFSVGYTPAERDRLADVAVRTFREIFGREHGPRSVAAWYLDARTLARLSEKHGVEAFAICRDQYGTDGYTFWGGPFSGGYYPSRRNTLSPAQTADGQIGTPVFRLLGPDPVHQYDTGLGTSWQGVLTMEPIYKAAGKNPEWVRRFLDIVAGAPALAFSHAQAGQENSFGWPAMAEGYAMQVAEFVRRRGTAEGEGREGRGGEGRLEFETLGDTGRWFRRTFPADETGTPSQAIVALRDTLGGARRSIWYHSGHYRCNLLVEGDRLYLRDLHLFDERYAERYLEERCDLHAARFDTLPVLDGFGWSASADDRALGRWFADGSELRLTGEPEVTEANAGEGRLTVRFPVAFPVAFADAFADAADVLTVVFEKTGWRSALQSGAALLLSVRWACAAATSFVGVRGAADGVRTPELCFEHEAFSYALPVTTGEAETAADGFDVTGRTDKAGAGGIGFQVANGARASHSLTAVRSMLA